MTYPIIPELYGIVARKLLDEIGEKSFYSGSFSFDYGSKECRFVASIVIYRSKECLPGKSSVSCPLKPSDSAPLKHSTMPP